MSWSDGYFTDLNYTHGYYPEMSPAMLRLVCLAQGIQPQLRDEPTYLELGFGQGVSINMHAAGSEGSFWGTDINPAHAVEARGLAAGSGADLQLFDDSFEEFAARTDLPEFDIIALHGIWSWVSLSNRQIITRIIRQRLRPGGIVYISYNCLPGWAPVIPIRQLMSLHLQKGAARMSGPTKMIEGALKFADEISKADSLYFKENPGAGFHLEKLMSQSRNYLAHEYLNSDWHLELFSDMIASLDEAKLTFVGSGRLLDGIDNLQLSSAGRTLISEIADPVMRETARDYLMNRRFRSDVFVKGARRLLGNEHRQAWHGQSFILIKPVSDIPKKVPCGRGEAELPADKYDPVIQLLSSENARPKRVEDLMRHPKLQAFKPQEIIEVLLVLVGLGCVSPAQLPSEQVRQRSLQLNEHILQRALVNMDLHHMVSPVTGGGVQVPHMAQLFLRALREGGADAEALAHYVWHFLENIGERLRRDGVRIQSKEENLKTIRASAQTFLDVGLPLLRALQVTDQRRDQKYMRADKMERLSIV